MALLKPRQSAFHTLWSFEIACLQGGGRAAAAPALSGPRSRSAIEQGGPLPHQHRFGMPLPGRPRMGPAIAGATTTLRARRVAFLQARPGGALAGGSGMRAQAPFAVAQAVAREHGVDEAMVVVYRRWPASVGRRTHAWAPGHAPTCTTSPFVRSSHRLGGRVN